MRLLWIIPILLLSFRGLAQQNQPLFPVNLDHEFPNPETTFNEVMDLILENYYSDKLTRKDLYWASIEGMLRHISPPENPELARIWTPEEYERFVNQLRGVDVSIGISSSFNAQEGSLTVTDVVEGSPSDSALFPYDRILRIDGQSLRGLTIQQVNGLLNGDEGSEVQLTVNRDIDILNITLVRTKYDLKNLEVHVIPGRKTALIKMKKITLGLADALKAELEKLAAMDIQSLIIDLRNNSGGVLNEGLNIANLFLQQNNIIVRTLARSEQTTPIVSNNTSPSGYDIIILANARTASASEVIIGALRDHGKATVIGTGTYGKSIIEETFTLQNEYRVKFIKSAMFTPRGISWQTRGFLPDILVEQDDNTYQTLGKLDIDSQLTRDLYLITAFKLID